MHGTVSEFRLAQGVTPSFHQGVLTYRDQIVAMVCDRSSPLLALAEPRVIESKGAIDCGPLTFLDIPELVAKLAELPGFRVLSKDTLDGPFDAAGWPDLLASDVKHWKPATVGEALFNYWD